MPTYGWVREDAWEAFLEGTEAVPSPGLPLPPRFNCPFCSRVLADQRELQDHVADEHRIDRPVFMVDGHEPASEFTIRKHCAPDRYIVANATSVRMVIDGERVKAPPPSELGRRLAELKWATVEVTLINAAQRTAAPVTSAYRISIMVADQRTLQGVELAFVQWITDQNLSIESIRKFLDDGRCQGTGADYADGLANYAMGILVKERPEGQDLSSPLARYRDLYGASLESLLHYDRPFATLLCSIIRFALNISNDIAQETGFWELDLASAMLKGPNQKLVMTSRPATGSRRNACPIDHGTGRILDLATRLARQDRWGPILTDECRQIAESDTLDVMDRQKALALWAATAWRLKAFENAHDPLAQLSATYPFSTWANACLETVSK
ncbi:hypothetical protein [Rhodoblastus sp.]|uniref:hypothetical protein n=1 Tax=Rhodoblastus sp. TaxID=1962975 RepID=UPI003F976872